MFWYQKMRARIEKVDILGWTLSNIMVYYKK